ncbi:MAG TPA: hypothetical protein VG269_20260 [Tepidisphaeraceae bacterium]|jgi:hypothetical protein|nr:hypothetical protein [Tepidisphaeraceae bacterium]
MHFSSAAIRFGVCVALAIGLASPALAGEEQVLRFKSSTRGKIAAQDHLLVIAEAPKGGKPTRLVVPNKTADRFDPDPQQANVVKALKPGDLIQVSGDAADGSFTLTSIAPYAFKPGEQTPNGYVFVEVQPAKAAADHPVVVLSKFGEKNNFLLAADKDGKSDPLIESALNTLKAGNSVWADVAPGSPPALVAILPWSEPMGGKLLKVESANVNGQKGNAVQIEAGGKTIVALVPGKMQDDKWVTDARVLAAARKLKVGSPVFVRTQEDGDRLWLRAIEPEPRPVAQRPVRPASDTDANGLPKPRLPGVGGVPTPGGIPGGF